MAEKKLQLKVDENFKGGRLDKCLAEMLPDYSRSRLQKLVKDGCVTVNGKVCTVPRTAVSAEDEFEVTTQEQKTPELIGEKIDLPIIFEDDHMLVINKPAGMVVHPAAGNWSGTVVNALKGRDDEFGAEIEGDELRPGIVHRLDKDTSGCLVIAKTQQAQFKLTQAFAERKTKKVYATIVVGIPRLYHEEIKTMIGRHPVNRKKMAVVDRSGKEAISEYELMEHGLIDGVAVSVLRVQIYTGRTHQIRVHMAHKKLPVLGDTLYGGHQKLEAPRQMLHAWRLKVPHPVTGREMSFKAPWPDDFQSFVDRIEPLPEG